MYIFTMLCTHDIYQGKNINTRCYTSKSSFTSALHDIIWMKYKQIYANLR